MQEQTRRGWERSSEGITKQEQEWEHEKEIKEYKNNMRSN